MKSRRNVFLLITLLYFLSKLLYVILVPGVGEAIVTPGWHTSIEYKVIYNDWFTAVFFLAIAAVYEQAGRSLSTVLFWSHVLISVIPLLSLAIWPFYFNAGTYDLDNALTEFRTIKVLEWFFIISQAIFTIVLLTKKIMSNQLRTT